MIVIPLAKSTGALAVSVDAAGMLWRIVVPVDLITPNRTAANQQHLNRYDYSGLGDAGNYLIP